MLEPEYTYQDIEDMPYAVITLTGEDRRSYHPPLIWELKLDKFQIVPTKVFDPKKYFATTGEAVVKTCKMIIDFNKIDCHNFDKQKAQYTTLQLVLEQLKQDNAYLETSWVEGRLILKAKNPRKLKDLKVKALWENFVG